MLEYLQARPNQWVPGLELMNQYVGGTRANARIHELRHPKRIGDKAHNILTGNDPHSDVDRYMLVVDEKPVQLTVEEILDGQLSPEASPAP